ncbi:acetoacetyl-CoA reductase [Noviherbaspirillum sp.]|uniref:acetoacetyl-CoA reductase n=1 Tax=Noviherbaspirillum sp. TaxID=1926288 RepID=UPI002B48021E|nr:acetoacetyl-CoA reductase [Noviherbaspirillum sp.]HJV81191.1 acetoacetyl-CoA reductase [Noviherbaspirillum sp.]
MRRTAIVTGGTRGLGKAISIALQSQGVEVAAIYYSKVGAAQAFSTATGMRSYKWDVSDFDACREGVSAVEKDLGPVDILVNNAGVTGDAMLHRMSAEQWKRVIDNDLGSVFNMCRSVIEGMRERSFGRIINIGSVNGQRGQAGQTNYASAKAGILGFTRALALEGARKNITVNAVAPGYCDTEMVAAVPQDILKTIIASIPAGRLGTPDDVARVVAFLASEQAGFINGATFSVNGGQYMS